MKAKRLGRTGVEIPVFGIGTAFLGGRACSAGESQLGEDHGVQTVIRRGYEVIPINTCAYLAMAYGK
tara:strand:+ start:1081 stop:1281 length:201 start_codon:yes stop_codon:yes gene_type:complete